MDQKISQFKMKKKREKSRKEKRTKDDDSYEPRKLSNCTRELFTFQICFKLECHLRFYKISPRTCNICYRKYFVTHRHQLRN